MHEEGKEKKRKKRQKKNFKRKTVTNQKELRK